MDPTVYVPAYLERLYREAHPELTHAACELLREQVERDPEAYATTEHAQALVSYMRTHEHLMRELRRTDELPDDEFERRCRELYDESREDLSKIWHIDQLCIDAELVDILLADVPLDDLLGDLLALEKRARTYLQVNAAGFDMDAPAYWRGVDDEDLPRVWAAEPVAVGWLHTLECIAQACIMTARYRAAARYARQVMRADGFGSGAVGTLLIALARLEDEGAFFAAVDDERARGGDIDSSPWFLLARTVLLYKLDRERSARRALRDFARRCEGGAYFLLNPTFHAPYLPVRPEPRDPWELTHQAVWEADGFLADTPDFAAWARTVEGVEDAADEFARRYGF